MEFFKNFMLKKCTSLKAFKKIDYKIIGLAPFLILSPHDLSADQYLQCRKLEITESFDASEMLAKSPYIYLVEKTEWIGDPNRKDFSGRNTRNSGGVSPSFEKISGVEGYQMTILEVIKGPEVSKFFLRGHKPEPSPASPSSISKKEIKNNHFNHHEDNIFWQDVSAGRINADNHNCFLPHFVSEEKYLIIGGTNSPKAYELIMQQDDKWLSTVKTIVQDQRKNLDLKSKLQETIKDFDEKARTG